MIKKNFLITGGAGYIGSSLTTKLVSLGHDVTVIDILTFNKNSLSHLFLSKNFSFVHGDVRDKSLIKKHIKNKDFIIPLAALVGAPLCKKYPKLTKQVNLDSIKFILKKLNKNQKILYPNTNSGYGIGKKNAFCDENSDLKPLSLYGRTKVDAEKIILNHKNSVVFRLATVFGYSYRMRTDLLVNFLVKEAVKNKKLKIYEPHFRRNYIHISDIVDAFVFTIENFGKMKGNIFNLGLSNANLTKIQLAKSIKKVLPDIKIEIMKNRKDPDKRDYYVSNRKIEKKGFKAQISIERGVKELASLFEINDFKDNKNNY
jgi:nucleoside-diphosphate-sugar epimerase